MKKDILFTLLIISIGFVACEKDKGIVCCVLPDFEYVDALKTNGTAAQWRVPVTDTVQNNNVVLYGSNGSEELKLKFYADPAIAAVSGTLPSYEALYTIYQRGSLPRLVYKLDNTAANEIKIINDRKDWISGFFNLTFKLAAPIGYTVVDTTRVYFKGGFKIKLRK